MNRAETNNKKIIDLDDPTTKQSFKLFFELAEKIFDEKRYRLLLGLFCVFIFAYRGSITWLHKLTGASPARIRAGRNEIRDRDPNIFDKGIRRKGAGRKPVEEQIPGIRDDIDDILRRSSYGNPQNEKERIYSTVSLRKIAKMLEDAGKKICHRTVLRIVRSLGFSKQMNRKAYQVGKPHENRNEQFEIIAKVRATAESFLLNPLLSLDAKAKVFFNKLWMKGKVWRFRHDPMKSMDHDYPDKNRKATPYGIYDVLRNHGYVSLGVSHDTAQFAVETLRRWWHRIGRTAYECAEKLIILCDGGGSNGSSLKLWKYELACMAEEIGLPIEVHHYPPGCSKHNLIEHRMFNIISKNWAGQAFSDLFTVLQYIRSATTEKGLTIDADYDLHEYETGIKIDAETFASIDLIPGERLGNWNYTIRGFKRTAQENNVAA